MKVRLKFAKQAEMRFIGQLDLMRFFQKAVRRSGLPIRFSEGMSPHMIMSFAAPPSLGMTSVGEYVDLELTQTVSSAQIISRLNASMVDGLQILKAVQIPEGRAQNAMSLVSASDYIVSFREGCEPETDWTAGLDLFLSQETIEMRKQSKKGESIVDIRPLIYELQPAAEGDTSKMPGRRAVYMKLSTGSRANLKPELVMEALAGYAGFALPAHALAVNRCELYADTSDGGLVPLTALGHEVTEAEIC